MRELKLWYNANRKKIWVAIGIIAALIAITQFFNFLVSRTNNDENNKTNISNEISIKEQIKNETNVDVESTTSPITGQTVSEKKLKEDSSIIGQFMEFCNSGNTQEAYNLLSENCKNNVFNTLEQFEQGYYQYVFGGETKIYTILNWEGNTYRVDIMENMLATGKSNNGYEKQDYITIEETDNEKKLNINSYIGHREINKKTEDNDNDIIVEVLSKEIFKEYEEYKIRVKNNRNELIILDSMTYADSLYLEDSKEQKYPAYTHELTDPMLSLDSGATKELNIKFYNSYDTNKNIKHIVFSNILVLYDHGSDEIQIEANV